MSDLQFETAEYAGDGPTCASCRRTIQGTWWLAGANPLCADCHAGLVAWLGHRTTPVELARAALFGAGAAAVGSVVWHLVRASTGMELGLLAIGVAWLVGWAVMQGGGRGLPQQLLAVALTALSIIGSYVPVLYTELAAEGGDPVSTLLTAIVAAFTVPVFFVQNGDVIWLLIVGIALWSAFRQPARPTIELTGPFQHSPAPAPPDPSG
jgi:hypothetical protein